eukprot:3232755-Rhodomonas_salina.2
MTCVTTKRVRIVIPIAKRHLRSRITRANTKGQRSTPSQDMEARRAEPAQTQLVTLGKSGQSYKASQDKTARVFVIGNAKRT